MATLDTGAATPRPGKRIAIAAEPVGVAAAQVGGMGLQFTARHLAGCSLRPVQPPVLVAAATEAARFVLNRSVAVLGRALVSSFNHERILPS
jgi:hypothetical protein